MLLIETYVANSPIHGRGVFAAEDVEAGAVLWREGAELLYSPEDFKRLSPFERNFIAVWGWKDKRDGLHHLPLDNDRFINHSDEPNTAFNDDGSMIAARPINRGDEILCNYEEFEAEFRFAEQKMAARR